MYLGIDIGTSSVKALLMKADGTIIDTCTEGYELSFPKPNWAEQNPDDWWKATKSVIKDLVRKHDLSNLKGISFSGQMHGLVALDSDDRVIRPAILWCDQRTVIECNYLNLGIGKEYISDYTGNIALTGFTAPKILWLRDNEPDNFKRISKIMLPKDYIAFKLSGVFATDYSDASGTLLLDVKNKTWSDEMLKLVGVTKNQLPELFESFEVIGTVKVDIADELSIPANTNIIIGGGDQAVGAIGTGAVREGVVSVALGTSGVVFAPTDNCIIDKGNRLHSFAHANGMFHQMGVMLSAAGALKWWVEDVLKCNDYERINQDIEVSQDSEELLFLPYLIGERTPHNDPTAKGAFIGIGINNDSADMSKAVMEGVAFALRDSLEILKSMKIAIDKIRISGGGSKSRVWNQLIANIFNLKIATIEVSEGPAFGAAILASVGCGEYPDVTSACDSIVKDKEVYLPIQDKAAFYRNKYLVFRKLYPLMKSLKNK